MKRYAKQLMSCAAALTAMTAAAPVPAVAAYPDKPIRIVVPYPAGGSTDVLARTLGSKVSRELGQPVIVENRAGASGNIGAAHVAESAPDGYTIFLGTSTALAVNQSLYANLPYDPQKDFSPVILATMLPSLVVATPSLGVATLQELIEAARERGERMNYASAGNGTPAHLGGELFKRMTDTRASHIPYKGGAPALADLVGGQTSYMIAILPEAMPLVQGGKLQALAVTTTERLPAYPDIPTVAESGVPGYEVIGWYGFLVPAGTSRDVIDTLNGAFDAALRDPETRNQLAGMGFEIAGGEPERLRDMMQSESAKWRKVIEEAGIKVD